jgi:hypothetical protein
MKITRMLVQGCGAGDDCPELHETDDGGGVMRGYRIPAHIRAQLAMPGNEDAVYLPPSMMADLRAALGGA